MGSHQKVNHGDKPILLFTSIPATGHITPTLRIASALHARGWPVFYLGPTAHKATISATGVQFLPFLDDADFNDLTYFAPKGEGAITEKDAVVQGTTSEPTWRDRVFSDFREFFISPIPARHRSLCAALTHIHQLFPPSSARVVVVAEATSNFLLPLFHGAPLPPSIPKPIGSIALSVMIPALRSAHIPPLVSEPIEFDTTPAYRERVAKIWRDWEMETRGLKELLVEKVEQAGGKDFAKAMETREREKGRESWALLSGECFVGYDHVCQIGVESWFYKTEEGWPANWRFVGAVPKSVRVLEEAKQALVDEVKLAREKEGKKVVVVAQGTVEIDPRHLILPTIQALGGREEDTLVVAILGHRGRTLPKDVVVPANAKVVDYLAYDAILPHADVFVSNAGYGAVMHGIGHGVPMVVAGEEQDKKENVVRVQWRGHGIKLNKSWRDDKEYVKELAEAVGKIMDEEEGREVRKRAMELKEEADSIDCIMTVEECLSPYL
ncbi:UDP-Glycosyltransferase/glycogen phosphorylase [Neurospora hispaniola]|uniref:UDP-Glycosyltransferase/glycogen phosphorylase n=1 Tax=Neurospora hispaniola TaxID=588809 RepID=A0AAJ0IE73_9PEZI|nr:UDP-Glycosyltransferase/glycogen phosphorylase [Neurospora hispaniola]